MQRRKGVLSFCLLLFLGWFILMRLGEEKASVPELTLATTIYFVCFIPLLIYFGRSERTIPYLPIFGVFYFIYFGFSIFNHYMLFVDNYLTPQVIIECLNLALIGFISLMLAFYSPLGKIVDFMAMPLRIPWDLHKAYRLGIFTGFSGIIVLYLSLARYVPLIFEGLVGFTAQLSLLGIAILFMLQLQGKLKFEGRVFLWLGLFIPKMFLDLVSGSTFPIILNFMILFFLYFYYYKSIPWLRLIMVLAIFFTIFSARDEFRELVWFGSKYRNLSPIGKGSLYGKLIYKRLSGKKSERIRIYKALSLRTDSLATFAKVVELTPTYIPFWGGYTYRTLWTTLIPRFIMPDKPKKTLGQEFGHRYMFLNPSDTSTSYNLSVVVEMYINFGRTGVIVGMFLLGLIFRIFYNLFNHPAAGEGGFLISAMIFSGLLAFEGDFSLVFGALIQYAILFYIIVKRMKLPIERIKRVE